MHFFLSVENIYDYFDAQSDNPITVLRNFDFDYKDIYFNDSLKRMIVDLFNDSIGWAKHSAKKIRQTLEEESDEYKYKSLKVFLQNNHSQTYVDSILNNDTLFKVYFDSLCVYEEEMCFNEGVKLIGYANVPNNLKTFVAYSRFSELYEKMLYYWKNANYYKGDFYYNYLRDVDCPEVIDMIETALDNNKWIDSYYMNQYRSESIRLLIKALDKTYLVPGGLLNFKIPLNVKLLGLDYNSWLRWVTILCEYQSNEIYEKSIELINQIIDCQSDNYKDYQQLSQLIIKNQKYLVPFLEHLYQNCINEELYWKQNMPYYKKE